MLGRRSAVGGYSGEPVDGVGDCVTVEGFDDVLCMAWRSDNAGPHDVNEACRLLFQFALLKLSPPVVPHRTGLC